MRERLVVIGNGMAGIKCVEEILQHDPERFDITIYGAEPHPNYNRIMLSKMLRGDVAFDDIVLNDWSWYQEHGIKLHAGVRVARIDTAGRYVVTASGAKTPFDILVLATGSSAFIPPIPGADKEGVMAFRTMEDCEALIRSTGNCRQAAVIGGGLLGLEAARGLLHLGMEAQVVHNAPFLMNRQLDPMAAGLLQAELERQGMVFHLSKNTVKITGRKRANGLRFADGGTLEADLVIMAVGIQPNIDLARDSGLHTNRAILVDDYLATSISGVYAVGECAEHRGIAYGLVAPLYEQARVLARSLCGKQTGPYTGSIPYSQLKVSGIDVFSAGDIGGRGIITALQQYDGIRETYKKVTMVNGKTVGAVLYGDISEAPALLKAVQLGEEVAKLAAPETGVNPAEASAAAMADMDTVCACNAVTKLTILQAVTKDGLKTEEEVRKHTKASTSCGGCRPMVQALVKLAASGKAAGGATVEPVAAEKVSVCDCTALDHEELKQAVSRISASSPGEIYARLGSSQQEGCEVCRPAVHYYLDLKMSHEGLRKPYPSTILGYGTASGMLIVQDESMGSGFAEEGSALAAELRLRWNGISLPRRITAAVAEGTGSPVAALIRDIGLVSCPAGWEVYAGGTSGRPVREAQLIGLSETADQAADLASACLQMYRKEAWYGEPLWKWLERIGLLSVRETLYDPVNQEELLEGLLNRPQPIEATR
ncbi:nitrite reductase large subunit NirB [Paenibacillus sp. P96]|uniref:Nitrite reductase large subunit NirB n=1 Tax=Paenibacillus zeirhizosphaerae TaxID=2987519 RepID=A0ABT9FR93_9BACL|nr:nitrite reductase large subunit NirB [Paenibacillus sp. P96]MDP4097228.1 nitrite reductase large subunit NirB [Paenibacillus sp. P96]